MRATSRTNRSAKGGARSSPHYGGEGVLIHPPHQGVCGRHGTEDQGVTPGELPGSSGGTEGSDSTTFPVICFLPSRPLLRDKLPAPASLDRRKSKRRNGLRSAVAHRTCSGSCGRRLQRLF